MVDENNKNNQVIHKHKTVKNSMAGGVYGLAFIGALVYYMQHATSFAMIMLGILKSIVWPAMLVYKLLEFLNM